jgi:phosphoribosylformylglycinamidine synthase
VGALPLDVTDNLNFGNPERPETMGQIVGCNEGMRWACLALDYPVVSGNVSLYNETNGQAILPTPVIGGIGIIDDVTRAVTVGFKRAGEAVLLVGETEGHLGASIYLREIGGREAGAPPPIDLDTERRNGDFVRAQILAGRVTACHDLGDGGLLVALAERAMAGGIGATLEVATTPGFLFGEDQGRYLLTTSEPDKIIARAEAAGVPARRIGTTGGAALKLTGSGTISVSVLRQVHESWLPNYMSGH